MSFKIIKNIIECFDANEMEISDFEYLEFHKYRYRYLLEIIEEIVKNKPNKSQLRLLDAGPAFQTLLIRKYFPDIIVDTVGYDHHTNHLSGTEKHYNQDFNEAEKSWAAEENNYDIIVFCEVIEHLYSKPEFMVTRLNKSLKNGGQLIIQTPNAAALNKRVKLLFGINPYELLLDNKMGHFREYTSKELKRIIENSGLKVFRVMFKNYFNCNKTLFHRLFMKFEFMIPRKLRDGITVVAQREV